MQKNFQPATNIQNIPSTGMPGGNMPQMGQMADTRYESRENNEALSAVSRARALRPIGKQIKSTRQDLADYLAENGVKLLTSALEFQQTGDFIVSSYVVYTEYGDMMESLGLFLDKYPEIKPSAEAIRDSLRPLQSQMRVKLEEITGESNFGSQVAMPKMPIAPQTGFYPQQQVQSTLPSQIDPHFQNQYQQQSPQAPSQTTAYPEDYNNQVNTQQSNIQSQQNQQEQLPGYGGYPYQENTQAVQSEFVQSPRSTGEIEQAQSNQNISFNQVGSETLPGQNAQNPSNTSVSDPFTGYSS